MRLSLSSDKATKAIMATPSSFFFLKSNSNYFLKALPLNTISMNLELKLSTREQFHIFITFLTTVTKYVMK